MRRVGPGVELPSGDLTFLFTDIEGSTRLWEDDPDSMRAALAAHDELLIGTVTRHGGHYFQHTGDGVSAVFEHASDAVRAAVDAQRRLELPVRMGIASGTAVAEDGNYFGTTLNRVARVMAAGHGRQVLVAASTATLVAEDLRDPTEGGPIELLDLGARRLRDLSEPLRIFQVVTEGLPRDFPPLRTVDAVPGNLPAQVSSFVGREQEVEELTHLVRDHRLVTLTGTGGVGKTRLSLQVAAELAPLFEDGVWFVELASLGDGDALPDLVASTLGVVPQAGSTVAASVERAVAGRRMLIVLDNCEHVLDAAAALVEPILARTEGPVFLATSREALRINGEHGWVVPPFAVDEGIDSAACSLFVERARAVRPDFAPTGPDEVAAIVDVCRQLDGIALAIELAAARTVSMTPIDIRDRVSDRFRLLSSGRRGAGRHQTLRQTVQWSYDLLDDDERDLLDRCSVFTGGFDLGAATHLLDEDDEYAVLDLLGSLVGKSLVTTEQRGGRMRYGMLETIRQFGEQRLLEAGRADDVRRRHATYFADGVLRHWEIWDGPEQRRALDWADVEHANLRTAYRWLRDGGDLEGASAIAAHLPLMVWPLQRFEPVGWAEGLIPAAEAARSEYLPRLYVAAALCLYDGRPDLGVAFAERAMELEQDPRFRPFDDGWSGLLAALAHLFAGRIERRVEISRQLAARSGFARVVGLCGLTWALPAVGRSAEAVEIADETLAAARRYGSPFWIGWALGGVGRAHKRSDPVRALDALREGLAYADEHRLPFWGANLAQDAAGLEAEHGDPDRAIELFRISIDSFHRAGNAVFLAATLASLSVFLGRRGDPERAAIVYGASTNYASINLVPDLADAVAELRSALGEDEFEPRVARGAAMSEADAVRYAHEQLRLQSRSTSV